MGAWFACEECAEAAEKAGLPEDSARFDSLNAGLSHVLATGHTVEIQTDEL
jgi:hypothetical protein